MRTRTRAVGVAMVKDELDVITAVITHMCDEVDALVVADNASTDGTRAVLADLARHAPVPMQILDDPQLGYYQSQKMTALAARAAASYGQDCWIVPFDADEVWYAHADRLAVVLAAQPAEIRIAYATLFDHFATSIDERDDNPFRAMVWRKILPAKLGKVAFRFEPDAVIHQGNHGVHLPSAGIGLPLLEVRHFPYRSPEQMIRKARNGAAAYAATDLPATEGLHWRSYGQILDQPDGEQLLSDVWRQHFWYASPVDALMTRDPAPWHRWPQPDDDKPS